MSSDNIIPLRRSAKSGGAKPASSSGSSKEPTRYFSGQAQKPPSQVAFVRAELAVILSVYGQMVSKGDWKDYAIDMLPDRAEFSIFRRATETPLYRIVKTPALANKQGQFSVIAPGGLILKRGRDLKTVLKVFDKQRFRVT